MKKISSKYKIRDVYSNNSPQINRCFVQCFFDKNYNLYIESSITEFNKVSQICIALLFDQ